MAGEEKQIVVEETTVVPGKMEFRLISPTESNFLKHIEWNKEMDICIRLYSPR